VSTTVKIAPSILSADFARLGDHVREAEAAGADWIHVDVMDGHFVPNITLGPPVIEAVRKVTKLPLDVHLMIEKPERHLEAFVKAAGNEHPLWITVHQETCPHLHRTVQQIRELGARPGVTINPSTPIETLGEIVPYVDLVLIMSVNPGFGGQSYIGGSSQKLQRMRGLLDEAGRKGVELEVDGGIDKSTASAAVRAGASVLVAGNAVFRHPEGVAAAIRQLRDAAKAGAPGTRIA
jgi:ribulose-phosphate 3-epimerase